MPNILIIDDEAAFRSITALTLQRRGFETCEAADVRAGTEVVRTQLPDLVLCDLHMEGADGYAMLEAMRRDPATATIPFILMTGMNDTTVMRRGMDLGADDFLEKPFKPDQLITAVNARLQKQQVLRGTAEKKLTDLRANLTLALPHELITPLNGIIGPAQLLSTDAASLSTEEVAEFGRTILESAERLHHTVENFLAYARLELQATSPDTAAALCRERTDGLRALIEARARHFASSSGRGTDLRLELADGVVAMGAGTFTKLVDEILDNAFKFSSKGSVVQVSGVVADGHYTIEISDAGCGMAPEQLAAVGAGVQFNRGAQEQQGAGLGLAIARRIAELHGGSLGIKSRTGQGTVVRVRVPVT
jgi:two-component system, sensor histidine kinase and response regulator